MTISFTVEATIPASPADVYAAWLDGKRHGAMTGGKAKIVPKVGGAFSAWDGYISGKTLDLVPNDKIVQSWRTSEFAPRDPDSEILITLKAVPEGTLLTIAHTKIPDGHTSYKKGWREHYFDPMTKYFIKQNQMARASLRS